MKSDADEDMWLLLGFGLVVIIGIYLINNKSVIIAPVAPAAAPAPAPAAAGGGGTQPSFNLTTCPQGIPVSTSTTGGTRLEAQKIGDIGAFEATWCGSVTDDSDEIAFKFWGPNHSDGNCCWCIMSVCMKDGLFSMRNEGPHPSYKGGTCNGFFKGGTYHPLTQPSCLKAVIHPVATGAHIEGYGLLNGKWTKYIDWSGACGNEETITKPHPQADFVLRFTVGGHKTTCATIRKLA
jgi:hypothetical protein